MSNRSTSRRRDPRDDQPGEWLGDQPGTATEERPPRFGVWPLALRRVLQRRCPQCGRGRLFQSWARLCERCDVCGLVYRREPGGELGAMYLSASVNQAFAALVFLAIWLGTDWGLALSLAVGVPPVLVFCYAFLPWSMGLWTAVEYAHDVGSGEWWARPRR